MARNLNTRITGRPGRRWIQLGYLNAQNRFVTVASEQMPAEYTPEEAKDIAERLYADATSEPLER